MTEQGLLDAVRNVQAGIDVDKHFRLIDGCLRPRLGVWFRVRPLSRDDANDVDELVQATMARVYTGMKKLERTETFLRWVFVIAKNVRTTALLERRRQRRVAGSRTRASVAPWAEIESEEEARVETVTTLRVAIDALPPQQRECLLLRISQELSYEEIAAKLRLSVNTVRNHLAGAKKRLRQVLSNAQKASAVSGRIPGDAAHPRRRPPSPPAAITAGPPRLSSRSRAAPPITPPAAVEPLAPAAGRSGIRRSRECRGRSSGGSWATASPGGAG